MRIKITKQVSFTVDNGELDIKKVNDSYHVIYYNHLFVGNPFKVPQTFSTSFTPAQIAKSSEVLKFLEGFN